MARESTSQSKGTAQSGRTRETREPRQARGPRGAQEPRGTREPRQTREPRAAREARETRDAQQRGAQSAPQERERPITATRETMPQAPGRGEAMVRRPEAGRPSLGVWSSSNPFVMMQRMAENMEQLMDEFGFGRTGLRAAAAPRGGAISPRTGLRTFIDSTWAPQVEVRQQGDRVVVCADLPGVERNDIQIDIENDFLTIRGQRRDERVDEEEGYFRSERMYGEFARTIPLPEGVDPEACEATFENGVLSISIPIPEQSQRRGRRIPVR